jgi:hypothetical protein
MRENVGFSVKTKDNFQQKFYLLKFSMDRSPRIMYGVASHVLRPSCGRLSDFSVNVEDSFQQKIYLLIFFKYFMQNEEKQMCACFWDYSKCDGT